MTSEMVQNLKAFQIFMFTDVLIDIHTVISIPIHKIIDHVEDGLIFVSLNYITIRINPFNNFLH